MSPATPPSADDYRGTPSGITEALNQTRSHQIDPQCALHSTDVQRQLERLLSGQEALQNQITNDVASLRAQIGALVERLARGDERMQQMRAELDRTASSERMQHAEDDIRELRSLLAAAARSRAEEKRDEYGRWAGIWPTIIATVAGGLLQAAVIGGIVAYALYTGATR